MKSKTAYLVINPRAGDNLAKLPDLLAVFAAAGWKTHTAVKEYGSHASMLAQEGADAKYDLVIAYGGDGTLNQVVNGVMRAKRRNSAVGLIPGGTANVWATEIGIPADPVKAALSLLNSEPRKVDVGHVEVESLTILQPPTGKRQPGLTSEAADEKTRVKREKTMNVKPRRRARHHFLLMAGLGIDAAIMRRVSKSLKEKIGTAAVALAAVEEMPSHAPFPIEIRASGKSGEPKVLWKGEALQVVIGNTRRYGNIAELTPKAKIDDGVLDVCVITAGSPLNTMQQILSLLLQRKASNASAEYFHGADFTISVPASIQMQVDGSAVKLCASRIGRHTARRPRPMKSRCTTDSTPCRASCASPFPAPTTTRCSKTVSTPRRRNPLKYPKRSVRRSNSRPTPSPLEILRTRSRRSPRNRSRRSSVTGRK